jgi:hypothetical protein
MIDEIMEQHAFTCEHRLACLPLLRARDSEKIKKM